MGGTLLTLELVTSLGSCLAYLEQQKALDFQGTDSRPYVLYSLLPWAGCTTHSLTTAGGGFPLQEADQEEQGTVVGHDGSGQAEGIKVTEQREKAKTRSLPTPLLPAPGEPRTLEGDGATIPEGLGP